MEIITALISSVIGGLLVAIVNHLFTRRKTEAEIDRIKAETKKILAEAEKISGDTKKALHTLGEVTYNDSPISSEVVIYDSTEGFRNYDFDLSDNSLIHEGILTLQQGTMLVLSTYLNNGVESTFVRNNEAISGYRRFHASCEMKVTDAVYAVGMSILAIIEGDAAEDRFVEVTETAWTKANYYFRAPSSWNFRFIIYIHRESGNGSLQMRNLVITERFR